MPQQTKAHEGDRIRIKSPTHYRSGEQGIITELRRRRDHKWNSYSQRYEQTTRLFYMVLLDSGRPPRPIQCQSADIEVLQ